LIKKIKCAQKVKHDDFTLAAVTARFHRRISLNSSVQTIVVDSFMKKRDILLNIVMFSGISLLITMTTYLANIWLFSASEYFSPTDIFFIEGIIFIMAGSLLLLGRGGINLWSLKAAVLSALAGAVYDRDTVGPAETLRKDVWKPKGFIRLALILILAGVFMILIYLLTL